MTQLLFVVLQFQSTVGTRKGRRGRNLALRPDEPAAMHELMAEDATPNLRVWQVGCSLCVLSLTYAFKPPHQLSTVTALYGGRCIVRVPVLKLYGLPSTVLQTPST